MLNHVVGEPIRGLETEHFIKVPLAKWADTSFWPAAINQARESFMLAGAMLAPVFAEHEVLVQEYPLCSDGYPRLAFKFVKTVPIHIWKRSDPSSPTKMLEATVKIILPPPLYAELRMAGRWPNPLQVH